VVIGLLSVRLRVRESRSLKDKRQVVRSILDRLRGGFNVSASEVATQDDHQLATIGVSAVGPEMEIVRGVLQTIQEAMRKHPVAEYLGGELSLGHEVV
jgi:uncharacterized protein YlxP (DUF503 family)